MEDRNFTNVSHPSTDDESNRFFIDVRRDLLAIARDYVRSYPQGVLARELGVGATTINRIARGQGQPRARLLQQVLLHRARTLAARDKGVIPHLDGRD